MITVGVFEAKTHLASLLVSVSKGEHVIITKHGHPIAKLVPAEGVDLSRRQMALSRLKTFNKGNRMKGLDWKELRDDGRK